MEQKESKLEKLTEQLSSTLSCFLGLLKVHKRIRTGFLVIPSLEETHAGQKSSSDGSQSEAKE